MLQESRCWMNNWKNNEESAPENLSVIQQDVQGMI